MVSESESNFFLPDQNIMKAKHQEKTPVRLKGMGNGLCIALNPLDPIDYLKEEIGKLFRDFKQLSPNSRIILDIGSQEGCDDLVGELESYLKKNFQIASLTRKPDKRTGSEAMILSGRVRSGQKINAKHHLILLGDVNPGAELIAGGDILIMGSLRGIVSAGQPDNENAIVLALDFRPTQIQIATLMAAGLPSSPHRKHPEFAYIDNGVIVVEEYLEANPFGRMPRIETR